MNIVKVREYIKEAMYFLEEMPEIDLEADITNLMPEDANAHQAGMAYQKLEKAIEELK